MIDNIKIGKVLGTGGFGKVYLCTYKGKKYALKIQDLTGMMDEKTNYTSDIWREIAMYRYVDTLLPSEQVFFNRMYEYKVYNETVAKIDKNIGDSKSKWEKNIKIINKSGWRVKYLLEYINGMTLDVFLYKFKSRLKPHQVYSLCLQILYIISLLKKGGFVHNDIHMKNILVSKTNEDSFIFNNKKVKYYGIQLSSIDYGHCINKKYKKGIHKYIFTEAKLMYDAMRAFEYVFTNYHENWIYCRKNNKNGLWNTPGALYVGIKKMLTNHFKFCNNIISKFLKIWPQAKQNIKILYSLYKTDTIIENALTNDIIYYNIIMYRLETMFYIAYPELHKEYFGWCRATKIILPVNECLEIFSITDFKSMTKWFLNKI